MSGREVYGHGRMPGTGSRSSSSSSSSNSSCRRSREAAAPPAHLARGTMVRPSVAATSGSCPPCFVTCVRPRSTAWPPPAS
eukprot:330293-Chlamydomonas_euryale.AAC.3